MYGMHRVWFGGHPCSDEVTSDEVTSSPGEGAWRFKCQGSVAVTPVLGGFRNPNWECHTASQGSAIAPQRKRRPTTRTPPPPTAAAAAAAAAATTITTTVIQHDAALIISSVADQQDSTEGTIRQLPDPTPISSLYFSYRAASSRPAASPTARPTPTQAAQRRAAAGGWRPQSETRYWTGTQWSRRPPPNQNRGSQKAAKDVASGAASAKAAGQSGRRSDPRRCGRVLAIAAGLPGCVCLCESGDGLYGVSVLMYCAPCAGAAASRGLQQRCRFGVLSRVRVRAGGFP